MILFFKGSDYRRSLSFTWYDRMYRFLMELGFIRIKVGSNLYLKVESTRLVYVDGLTGEDELIVDAKGKIATKFEMEYIGMMHYFLGMEVWHSADGIFLGKGKYTMDILKRFKMLDCKEIATPMAYIFEASE